MAEHIQVAKENRIAVVTIDHPPLNVLSRKVIGELHDTFLELRDDSDTVVVILTGAGNRAFAAGADIKEFPQLIGQDGVRDFVLDNHQVLNDIDSFPKPTIAVLNGVVFGGGCELALTCDLRIAEEHAQIALPEITLGLFPGWGGTQRLPRLIGEARAKEMMFTGEPVTAAVAERIGLVNKVAASGEGLQEAKRLAAKIARHSLQALSRIKQAVDYGLDHTVAEGIDREAELFDEVFQTEDVREGVQAFIEKRKPIFRNR
ncbi:Enoyl-CoA hydratase/carnithine racemase [Paenibacillus sp. yr247]|uniref:enoyl-CoA hydratase-related protein n=1 Tax=Paenibacillus sp. yr247 TaxID=1761880 RepID=UPI0008877B2D|nr:enoyl-CoA hydratase-related protein [Paenibacillus sp. yr247]SDN69191.1 Enoyl-CoA hydratase/carnithine racemase [Paenibacillus sp. yr247]